MGDTWITDMQHFLEDGNLGRGMPTPALNIVLHLGSIVAWMTSREATGVQRTNVPCRRSPGRRRCTAEIEAEFEKPGEAILWHCPRCGDNGYIRGWQGTPWDRGKTVGHEAAQPLRVIEGLSERKREKIAEGDRVPVRFTARDRKLLDDLHLDPEYVERLRPVPGSTDLIGDYDLNDLEDMLGYIAAEANHTKNSRLKSQLDDLFDRLSRLQRRYDDGNWGDSGI